MFRLFEIYCDIAYLARNLLLSFCHFFTRYNKYLLKTNNLFTSYKSDNLVYIVLGGESAAHFPFKKIKNNSVITVNYFYKNDLFHELDPAFHVMTDSKIFADSIVDGSSQVADLLESVKGKTKFLFPIQHLNDQVLKDDRVYPFFPKLKPTSFGISNLFNSKLMYGFSTVALSAAYLAIQLGYKKIYFIGFDLPPGNMPHFYDECDDEIKWRQNRLMQTNRIDVCERYWQYLNAHMESFYLNDYAIRNDVEVYNFSKDSWVQAFPKINFTDVIK